MNNGAFGENFPYSNFHDMNMDWIIKIAKDFLDQYTHIQEVIDTGETNLETTAERLETLLQEWYDTHSSDIANQLEEALRDINAEMYVALNNFNNLADNKAISTLESIPDDYANLYNEYVQLRNLYTELTEGQVNLFDDTNYLRGQYYDTQGVLQTNAAISQTGLIPITQGHNYTANYIDGFVLWYAVNNNPNLFNRSDFLEGQYYDRNGNLQTNANICQTGIISVEAGNNYTANYIDGFVLWYNNDTLIGNTASETFTNSGYVTAPANANGARFIMGANHVSTMIIQEGTYAVSIIGNTASTDFVSTGYVTAPSGANYSRFIVATDHVNDFVIQEGTAIDPLTVTNAVLYIKEQNLTDEEKETARNNIDAVDKTSLYISSKNLFNPSNYLRGQYYDINGVLQTNSAISQTAIIPVIGGSDYTANFIDGFVLWYTNGELMGNASSASFTNNGYVTAPALANGSRFIVGTSHVSNFQVEEGQTPTAFIPYGGVIPKTSYYNKKAVVFGTSLTRRDVSYMKYLPSLSGMDMDNMGVNSGTILYNSALPNACIYNEITGYTNYADKDICIIEGFANDWNINGDRLGSWYDTSIDSVCGCLRNAINHISSQKQNITIIVIIDHYGKNNCSTLSRNAVNQTQYEFYSEIIKTCHSIGIPVIKENELSQINENNPYYLVDNIHLTELGAQQSAQTIWSVMKTIEPNK